MIRLLEMMGILIGGGLAGVLLLIGLFTVLLLLICWWTTPLDRTIARSIRQSQSKRGESP